MLQKRIIPALLMKGSGLVKTRKFKNPLYVGDPINILKIFNEKEVDEIFIADIDASKQRSGINFELIEKFAGECFMPVTYAGGVNSVDQAKNIFALGVEKICIQSAAFENTKLISDLVDKFGSQSIVVSVDIKKNWFNNYELFYTSKEKSIRNDWKQHMTKLVKQVLVRFWLTRLIMMEL